MKLEIPVSDLEKQLLQHTFGYYEQLPLLLTSRDIRRYTTRKRSAEEREYALGRYSFLDHCLFLSPQERAGLSALLKLESDLKRRQFLFWKKYPYVSRTRGVEMMDIFEREVVEVKKGVLREFQEESEKLSSAIGSMGDKDMIRRARAVRSLYGVLGIVQGFGITHKYFYKNLVIPSENFRAVERSISTGLFEKEISDDDRRVLDFLFRRTLDIKGDKKHGHNPRFSVPQILEEYGGTPQFVRECLYCLTGVLCHAYGPSHSVYTLHGASKAVYWDSWFLPHNRFALAKEIIR